MIDERARFDRLAADYDRLAWLCLLLVGRRRRQLLSLARGRVLEVGIGTASTLADYPPGVELIGVDLSRGMLQQARRRSPGLPLAQMSAEDLGFPAGSFDTVVLSLVLCSVADPLAALREMRRVLVPGGRLLMLEHVRPHGRLGSLFDRLSPWWYQHSCHLNRRTADLVPAAGFNVERLERSFAGALLRLVATSPGS